MDNAANVRPVDPHTKGDRGDDDIELFLGERLLDLTTVCGVEPGVVAGGTKTVAGEPCGHGLRVAAADAIDDGRLPVVPLQDVEGLLTDVDQRQDPIVEVCSIEAADEDGRIAELQLVGDIVPHPRRCSGGKSMQARFGEVFPEERQPPVFGPEVMPPLADAVCFVDGKCADAAALDPFEQPWGEESFRGHEDQPAFALGHAPLRLTPLLASQPAVQRDRLVADRT